MSATDKYERMNEARERLMAAVLDDGDLQEAACFTLGLLDDLVGPHMVSLDDELDFQDLLLENEDLLEPRHQGIGIHERHAYASRCPCRPTQARFERRRRLRGPAQGRRRGDGGLQRRTRCPMIFALTLPHVLNGSKTQSRRVMQPGDILTVTHGVPEIRRVAMYPLTYPLWALARPTQPRAARPPIRRPGQGPRPARP